ncbi:hypothetical protein CDL12_18394 [Handroanthus impetiginosus]|uniref:Uncharacterized protein n=1 Tax=Handroanthus impetiginosus TaxID=429701 RepID=A0A2G9GUT1_9LAMI|nr:hypothetical protein CDL12_18394 [Handroanthus impetiginosus]
MITLTEECSKIIQKKLSPKLEDPGRFTIPCEIGTHLWGRALCDLKTSIKLMPHLVYHTLGLIDKSLSYPRGIIENVLVKVDKFIFPTNFLIFDMEMDSQIPIIIERPFLAVGRTLIDVKK